MSTKIRPNKKCKTDRKDLDGVGIIDSALKAGLFGSQFYVDVKKDWNLLTDPGLFKFPNKQEIEEAKKQVKYYKNQYKLAKQNGYKNDTIP